MTTTQADRSYTGGSLLTYVADRSYIYMADRSYIHGGSLVHTWQIARTWLSTVTMVQCKGMACYAGDCHKAATLCHPERSAISKRDAVSCGNSDQWRTMHTSAPKGRIGRGLVFGF